MNINDQTTNNSTICQTDIKSEPFEVESTHSDEELEGTDNAEEGIYKNLTEEQLLRARKYNECFICQKRCANFTSFRSHVFLHTSNNKYKCEKCFKEYAQLKYLKAHLTTHNENRVLTCDICSQNFASKSSIRGHMRVHTGEKPYKCHLCDRAFSESSSRNKHMLTHLPDKIKQLPAYSCEICGKIIKSRDSFRQHMLIHTGDKNVECPICYKSFARKTTLRVHMATHTDSSENRPREHICAICSKGFHHRASLWKHRKRSCSPLTPTFQCEMCAKIFKDIVARVQGDEEGRCNLCGKIFKTARGLRVHLHTHANDKKFQCIICANKCTLKE